MSFIRALLYGLCSILVLTTAPSFAELLTGIEQEYFVDGPANRSTRHQNATYLLAFVKKHFGRQGSIQFHPWTKWQGTEELTYAEVLDGQGRAWRVEPEHLNGSVAYDGYELVPPPLNLKKELRETKNLLADIKSTGYFKRGEISSSHFSYDVAHLISVDEQGDRDFTRIVNLILFIENHMLEIMNAVGAFRTGHTFSAAAVPLGLNQAELLHELAQPQGRSRDQVRGNFSQFMIREYDLTGNIRSAWKNRSVNYAKVLQLGLFSDYPVPLLEFRLPDLVDETQIEPLDGLFQRIIEVGSQTPATNFTDPFTGLEEINHRRIGGRFHDEVDQRIKNLAPAQYRTFIEEILGLSRRDYPQRYLEKPASTDSNSCEAILVTHL